MSTKETLTFSNSIAGFLQGRSSVARIGLNIHAAGFFDPGFSGTATLEVTNFTQITIILYENMRICQMVFVKVAIPSSDNYGIRKESKYQGQKGPTLSKIHEDN